MQNRREIYFPADDRTIVTGLSPSGRFVAFDKEQPRVRGRGHSLMAAIGDLREREEVAGSIYERTD